MPAMDDLFGSPLRPDAVDTVSYEIHCALPGSIADPVEAAETFAAQATSFVSQWTTGYIWHKDPFVLTVAHSKEPGVPPYVAGSTRFGDCIEDEWFIVSLLQELTKKFPESVASIRDSDGEFLLIEAAEFLPRWLDPLTSQNRVFLHGGSLHLIPLPRTPAEIPVYPSGKLSLSTALALVRGSANTIAPADVRRVITERLAGLPAAAAAQNMHHARCFVPHKIAHILHYEPTLVAPAVEAFYTRDPIAMRACYKMTEFPPATNVMTSVRMNRHQYAQLVGQRFHPPKPFRLPPSTAKDFKQHDLGMKLACGFEMLMADEHLRNLSSQHQGHTVESYNFKADPEWRVFCDRLEKLTYFRDETPGSRLYKELEEVAHAQYLSSKDGSPKPDNPIDRIEALLALPLVPEEELSQLPDESDRWMEVDPQKLEDLLNGQKLDIPDEDWTKVDDGEEEEMSDMDDDDRRDMEELAKMFGGFTDFVQKESGIDGALFPGQTDQYDDGTLSEEEVESHAPGGNASSSSSSSRRNPPPLRFDQTRFAQSMLAALGVDPAEHAQMQSHAGDDILQPAPSDDFTSRFAELAASSDEEEGRADDSDEGDSAARALMREMDAELAQTKIGASFATAKAEQCGPLQDDDEATDPPPIDLDLNLVQNILASFEAQEGLPGPAGSMLGSLGIRVPKGKKIKRGV
ncbi:SGT1 protein-domain-containing protein [Geranomyces variabilis]|nr:SGT1 protein-domain-containing protein [Geranomyces variabilis]